MDDGDGSKKEIEVRKEMEDSLQDRFNGVTIQLHHMTSHCYLMKHFLRSCVTMSSQSSMIYKMRQENLIRSDCVMQSMLIANLSQFSPFSSSDHEADNYDTHGGDDDSLNEIESTLRNNAIFLETIYPYLCPQEELEKSSNCSKEESSSNKKKKKNILVLISGFSTPLLLSLAWIIGGEDYFLSLGSSSSTCTSTSSSSSSSAITGMTPGSVIAKPCRSDIRILMRNYKYLLDLNVLRINVLTDSSILKNGCPKFAPYDLILVPQIGWAEGLKHQLKTNAILVNPFNISDGTFVKSSDGSLHSL